MVPFNKELVFPEGLEIEPAKSCHEPCKCHCDKSIAIDFNPIGDLIIIKAVENLGNLFIIANVFF